MTVEVIFGETEVEQFGAWLEWALKVPPEFYFRDNAGGQEEILEIINETPRRRLESFCVSVKQNDQISPETLEWLAAAGRQYLADESTLELALGLEEPKKRGRPPEKKASMAGLRMFALKHLGNEKYDVALMRVMGESNVSERSVKRAYAVCCKYAEYVGWCQKAE